MKQGKRIFKDLSLKLGDKTVCRKFVKGKLVSINEFMRLITD